MEFKTFVDYADRINKESSNTRIIELVSELLDKADEDALEIIPRFLQGEIFTAHDNRNTHISTSLMRKSISEAIDVSEKEIKNSMSEISDMGELFDIYNVKSDTGQQRINSNNLKITEVYKTCFLISESSGKGSQETKINYLVSLFYQCSNKDAKYLTRLILNKMSIGVGLGTIRKSISKLYDIPEDKIERALMLTNDAGEVSKIALNDNEKGIDEITINVCNIPILSMKAKKSTPLNAMEDMDEKEVYTEYKYDGFRIQAHKKGDEIKLYTRNLQDVTSSLPDVVKQIKNNISEHTIVLDGEIVGYETTNYNKPVSYQKTQKRIRRKYDIEEMIDEIPVKPHFFDILYSNNSLLLDEPFEYRREKLENICPKNILSDCVKCNSISEIQKVMSDADVNGHEGAMVKNPKSKYEPNSRGKKWLKLKPEGETIDATVIGGEYGDGRRSDYISSFELAIWDSNEELVTIGNVGNGISDDLLLELTTELEDEIISKDGKYVDIRPVKVLEVKFEEVQKSTKFTSGYGLRFPRVTRIRDTKTVKDIDTVKRLENIAESIN